MYPFQGFSLSLKLTPSAFRGVPSFCSKINQRGFRGELAQGVRGEWNSRRVHFRYEMGMTHRSN